MPRLRFSPSSSALLNFQGEVIELSGSLVWYGMVWYGMAWYGMVWYGNTLFNDAGPDSNLLISTGGVKTVTIYKKEKGKRRNIYM